MANKPFKIDGVEIPTPTKYEFSAEDLSSEYTGRTLDGIMHKDVVAVKDTYDCAWNKLSFEETERLLNLTEGKEKILFTHIDPRRPNGYITGEFYIGARKCVAKNLKNRCWNDITMTFIRI